MARGWPGPPPRAERPPLDLAGTPRLPVQARGIIVFAHGSGSSRLSPRNAAVAETLAERGYASLLVGAVRLVQGDCALHGLPVGLFGASTGAAAALVAAAELGSDVAAVVSRGGRPDLAGDALERVRTPTLLIVGAAYQPVIKLDESAMARLNTEKSLIVVLGATHHFPECGALEAVIEHALRWFDAHIPQRAQGAPG
jgi:predicted alpha/beta-hydrolase family hydrolase